MHTTISTHSTPTHHPPMRIGGAAFGAGLARSAEALTPLSGLNRRFRELANKYGELENLASALADGPSRDAVEAEKDLLLNHILNLEDKAVELPAQTIEDAAIQALLAYYRVEHLMMDEKADDPEIGAVTMLLASVVLGLGRIGGFDIDRIGWGRTRELSAFRALAGSAAA